MASLGQAYADAPSFNLVLLENVQRLAQPADLFAKATGKNACDMGSAKGVCANKSQSYSFSGCTIDEGKATLTGGWDEVFAGPGADQCATPLVDGQSVVRTSKGLTVTMASGEVIQADTLAGKAYDGTEISDKGLEVSQVGQVENFKLNGAHVIYKDKSGNVSKEVFALSTAPVLRSGVQADGTLVIPSGSVRVFDQLEKYTSDISAKDIAWSDKACCHPVSGSITEVMSGAKTGTRTLTFTSQCGVAHLVDQGGAQSDVNMPACQ